MHKNTKTPASAWMKLAPLIALGSCMSVNQSAICDGTLRLRDAHADALIEDGGQKSIKTGAALIASLDAGCGDV